MYKRSHLFVNYLKIAMIDNSAILVTQLRATLGKMEVALGAIVEAIVWTDEKGRVHWSNATFDRLVNRQRFQVLGASLFDLLPLVQQGQQLSSELHPLSIALNKQSNVTGVYEFPRADKKLILEISSTRIQIQGQQTSAVVVIRDITLAEQARERQAMQVAVTRILAESATLGEAIPKLLEAICDGTGWEVGAMWQLDANTNLLRCPTTWHNPKLEAADFEHISRETTLTPGLGLPGRVWASGQPAWITDVVTDSNFPRAEVAAQVRVHGAFAFPILNGSNVTAVMEFFSRHPKQPDEEIIKLMVDIGSQIDQFASRVLAEEALRKAKEELEIRVDERTAELRKSQKMLQLVMDNIPQFICWKDRNSVYLGCNRNLARLAGVGSPENIIGKTDYDLPWQQEQAKFFCSTDARVMETDTPEYHVIQPTRSANGTQIWLDTNKIPLHDAAGKVVGILVTIEDITERQRASEEIQNALSKEKQLIELKSRFITTASHEFRTPLATILSSSELLEQYGYKFSEEKKLKYLKQIQAQVKRMTQLLEDVLFVGKASANRMEFNPVKLNLEEVCREFLSEIEVTYGKRHTFNFDCQGDCSNVEMDLKLLRQMLVNLLSNAVKYSPEGCEIDLKLICDNGQAIFTIRDSGIGIPESDRERLFEVFHRGSNVGNISGTGLGMTIVQQAVELHGGAIAFESEVGAGTTFTVSLPTRQR